MITAIKEIKINRCVIALITFFPYDKHKLCNEQHRVKKIVNEPPRVKEQ